MCRTKFISTICFLAGSLLTLSTQAYSLSGESLRLDLNLSAQSFHTDQEHSVFMGPTLDILHQHFFDENIESRLDVAAELFTGSATGIFPPDVLGQNGPRQDLRLREALVSFHWLDHAIEIDVGAINQQVLGNPLLGGDYAFLGSLQQLKADTFAGRLGLTLEEGFPPSSFSLLETAAQEQTPEFYLAQISDEIGSEQGSNIKIFAGLFEYKNLSTAQARQSLFFGNTVTGNSSSASFFLPYRGYEGGLKATLPLASHWRGTLSGNIVRNTAAPQGSNVGYLGKFQINYLGDTYSVSPEIGYFNDQSDSAPAVFSDSFLNSKNHKGYLAGVVYKNDAKKYSLFGRWMHSDPLVSQLYGSSDNSILLGTEVRYDLL
jgi:hypothetical protein